MLSLVESHVRRTNRNLLLINLGVLICLILVSLPFYRYYFNYVFGPFSFSQADLQAVTDARSQLEYFVTVQGDTTLDSGLSRIEQRVNQYSGQVRSESTVGHYQLLRVGQRVLIVINKEESSATSFTGSLEIVPADVRDELANQAESPSTDPFFPFILNTVPFRSGSHWGAIIWVLVLALSLWNISRSVARFINPQSHPIYASLRQYGEPLEVAGTIDNDDRSREGHVHLKGSSLTANWLVVPSLLNTQFVSLASIIWIYKQQTKQSINGISSGSTFKAIIATRSGKRIEIDTGERGVDKALESLSQRAPWVQVGYSDELETLYEKNRVDFIAHVDDRRSQMKQGGR